MDKVVARRLVGLPARDYRGTAREVIRAFGTEVTKDQSRVDLLRRIDPLALFVLAHEAGLSDEASQAIALEVVDHPPPDDEWNDDTLVRANVEAEAKLLSDRVDEASEDELHGLEQAVSTLEAVSTLRVPGEPPDEDPVVALRDALVARAKDLGGTGNP